MIVCIYNTKQSHTIEEFESKEVTSLVELLEQYGYTDENGNDYKFEGASVEFPHTFCIYVTPA